MSEDYTKLAADIVYSSIWEEDAETCKVWVTMLALKNRDHVVDKNVTGIARLSKVPLEKCLAAIAKFEAPDPLSTSQKEDGRKLLKVPGGWLVVNGDRFQELGWSDDKKAYERKRKAEYRARKDASAPVSVDASIPTFEEVKAEASLRMISEETAKDFFEYWQEAGWLKADGRLIPWRYKLRRWSEKGKHGRAQGGKAGGGNSGKEVSGHSKGTYNEHHVDDYSEENLKKVPNFIRPGPGGNA